MKKNWYSERAMLLLQEIENLLLELPISLGDLIQMSVIRRIMREPGEVIAEETIDRRIRETVKELRGKGRGKKALIKVERVLAIPPSIRIKNLTPFGRNLLKAVRDTEWCQNNLKSSSKQKNNSKTTIILYRDNVVEFLSQLVENNRLEPFIREKAEEIATTFFKKTPSAKNVVLAQIRCPVCNSESFAIQTYDEEKMLVLPEVYEMNASTLLKKALQLIYLNPKLIVLIFSVFILEIFTRVCYYNTLRLYYLAAINTGESFFINPKADILYAFNPFLLLVDLSRWLFTLFILVWVLVYLKEREDNPDYSIEILKSLKKGFHFLPQLLVVFLLIALVSISLGSIYQYSLGYSIVFPEYNPLNQAIAINNDGPWQLTTLPIRIGVIIVIFFLSYYGAVIVFDGAGIREGIKKSAVFTNEHKGTTFGVLIGSMAISLVLLFLISFISVLMEMYIGFSTDIILFKTPSLTFSLNTVNTISQAFISGFYGVYQFVAYSWAYGRFASTKS